MRSCVRTAIVFTNILLAIALFVPLAAQTTSAGQRPFTFEDMMALKRISGPSISPDGRWVMFSAVDVDLKANTKTSHLWLVPLAGGAARQITSHQAGESGGQWSPDNKRFLFVSARDGSSQVWVSEFDSASGTVVGEPKKVTSISTEADGAMWFPDGKQILFASEVYPECDTDACNKAKDDARAGSKVKANQPCPQD